jgi:single-stranded-DNA-specific exonuclease
MNKHQYTNDLVQTLLKKRGVTTKEEQEVFVNPDFVRDTYNHWQLHDMEKAVMRIIDALNQQQKIVVYADYDADGIPGAVIFSDFFNKINYDNFEIYIPHRHDEGYGLHHDAIEQFIKDKVDLLVTIDLGITAVQEVAHAKEHGLDIIVTDHHEAGENIPDAYAVVNPKLGDYPDPMLCGAAVAWKLVSALIERMHDDEELAEIAPAVGWEKWLLDMVGIATLSDMVPLLHENRTLAWYGLHVLRKTKRLGLLALLKKMYMRKEYLLEDDITFMITPRINAASRMAHPMDAFKLLATDDVIESHMMTQHLVELNDERKKLVAQTMREAHKKLKSRDLPEIIVIGNPEWKAGILGLVASKIVEEFKRPAFVWSRENGHIKGSCRTYGNCDLHELMSSAPPETFSQFGGHKEAGGFSTTEDAIHDLEKNLLSVYIPDIEEESVELEYDASLLLSSVNYATYNDIRKLAPFGVANPKPQFLFSDVEITDIRIFGKQKNHIELTIAQNDMSVKAMKFFADAMSFSTPLEVGMSVSCIGHIEEDTFGRNKSIRLRLVDIMSS